MDVTEKMVGGDSIMGLTAVAVAHALVVAVMISAGLHISGGHLNPAVTLGLAVGGHVTVVRSLLYVVAQLLGSTLACLLLKYLTGGLVRFYITGQSLFIIGDHTTTPKEICHGFSCVLKIKVDVTKILFSCASKTLPNSWKHYWFPLI